MSDFRLSEVAGWLGKDERTLRRWCIAGMVPSAFLTAGGHWRVRAEHPRKVRIVHKGFRPRNRGVQKTLSDQLRKTRAFHARGGGRAFLLSARSVLERLDQLDFTSDDRERIREALLAVLDAIPSAETSRALKRLAAGIWEWESNRLGRRGEMGAASIAGIPRTTFRLYFSRYLSRCVDADPEPEPCDYPDHATERERNAIRLAAMHHRDSED